MPVVSRSSLRFVLSFVIAMALSVAAAAQEKARLNGVALVVGQSRYAQITPLPNPANDARAIAALLGELGFDVRSVSDRDAAKLRRDIERFVEDASEADVALFYYSGHGIEAGGENFLVPVDASAASLENASGDLVSMTPVLSELARSVPLTIVLLDACRTNPFPPGATIRAEPGKPGTSISAGGLSVPRGAAIVEDGAAKDNLGTVIGFAAEPGRPALDGEAGGNSPYAAALVRHLSAMTGAEFGAVMRMVGEEVYLTTKTQQRPWVNESLRRLLYFGMPAEEPRDADGLITRERRQLLLTIADLPSLERTQVEIAAKAGNVPLDSLYGVLRALGTSKIPEDPAELDKLLQAQAKTLQQMVAERDALKTGDPEILRLTGAADKAIKQGAIATARQFLDDAVKRVEATAGTVDAAEEQLRQKRIADATIYMRRGEASSLAFDYRAAAADYAKAYSLIAKWDEKLSWNSKNLEAEALNALGAATGDKAAFDGALRAYETILATVPAGAKNRDWAITRNNMAVVLQSLGEREPGRQRLDEAAGIFRESLAHFERDKDDANWAAAQNNLANTLLSLGKRERDTKLLEQAVAAFRATLRVRKRDTVPLEWASSQNNIGITLYTLGEREASAARLEEAEAAYRAGLEAATREAAPAQWAMLQNNLGNTLNTLGTRKNDPAKFEQAAHAFRAAMEVRNRERLPMQWAMSQLNLGNVLNNLGKFDTRTTRLEEAAAAYRAALEVFTREKVPFDWASAQNNLGSVLQTIGQKSSDVAKLEESAAAFRAALEEYTRERVPLDWAMAQNNLGNSLQLIGKFKDDVGGLKESVAVHRSALSEYRREDSPMQWALVQTSLGSALEALGFREEGTASLNEATAARRSALEVITRENSPLEWAMAQNGLGTTLLALGNREQGTARFAEAKAAFDAALLVYTREEQTMQWAFIHNSIGDVHWAFGTRGGTRKDFENALASYETAKSGFAKTWAFPLVALSDKKIALLKEMMAK